MADSDMEAAKKKLAKAKAVLFSFLKTSYSDPDDAYSMFSYFEKVVEKVCARRPYEVKISGGAPSWHAKVFVMLGTWIRWEHTIGELLFDQLEETAPETEDDIDFDFEDAADNYPNEP